MHVSPGIVAYLALIIWLPISLGFFAFFRPAIATLLTLLGAMLLLPVRAAIDFPVLPAIDKELVGSLAALLGVLLVARNRLVRQHIGRGIESLVFLLMAGAILTAFTNGDLLFYGPAVIPGLHLWDGISSSIQQLLTFGIPFVLGRVLFTRSRDLRLILVVLVLAGILYSLPILYEIRMSPQLHRILYGYHQHRFHMTLRLGGYRPMVFMPHGLPLVLFVLVTAMAATTLARLRARIGPVPAGAAALYLSGILVLCRGLGAMVYGVFILPAIALLRPRWQLRLASLLAVLVIAYPTTRALGLFPADDLVSLASAISEERADSLSFRFENEDLLLEKARQRVWFGWGGYDRNRVFDEYSGDVDTVTDGYWIIQLGSRGAVGFIGAFGLLLLPIWYAQLRFSRIRSRRDRRMIAGLALVLAVYSVDLLPNGFLLSFAIFLAGALTGLVSGLQVENRHRVPRERPRRPAPSPNAGPERADSGAPSLRDLGRRGRPLFRRRQRTPWLIACPGTGNR